MSRGRGPLKRGQPFQTVLRAVGTGVLRENAGKAPWGQVVRVPKKKRSQVRWSRENIPGRPNNKLKGPKRGKDSESENGKTVGVNGYTGIFQNGKCF